MKNIIKLFTVCVLSFAAVNLASCGEVTTNPTLPDGPGTTIEEGEPYVQSLEIVTMPTKKQYREGEIFDPQGMNLKATWSHLDDETGLNIVEDLGPYDVTYSKNPIKEGTTSIDVSYENQTVQVPITVVSFAVKEIRITVNPNMMVFTVEDTFKLDGMVVLAVGEDNSTMIIDDYSVAIDSKDVTNEIKATGVKLTEGEHTVTISYKNKSASFKVMVYDGVSYKVEAEKMLGSSRYPVYNANDKYYVEPNAAMQFNQTDNTSETKYIIAKENEPASGGAYLGEMSKVGRGFTLHIWSDFDATAVVSMTASSCVIAEHAAGSTWTPTRMKDIQLNQMIKMNSNSTSINIEDSVILPGGSIEDVGAGNNSLLWVNWQSVDLGKISLKKGDNTIYIEVIATHRHGGENTASGSLNFDCFDVIIEK